MLDTESLHHPRLLQMLEHQSMLWRGYAAATAAKLGHRSSLSH
jgi:hypothetical protein